jgi:hypothetical protein
VTDLTSVLSAWRKRRRLSSPAGDTSYEQVTRERVDGLRAQVDRIEVKINGLLLALVGAALAEIYRAVAR